MSNEMRNEVGRIRCSNIELLRIISMILVMIVHACFLALDYPTKDTLYTNPYSSIMKCFCESFSIVCVNSFVLISGWFGIRPRFFRLLELMFQVVFFCGLIQVLFVCLKIPMQESFSSYWKLVLFSDEYWFVRAYVVLWLFSPLLNAFSEHSDRRSMWRFLVAFFVVQTLVGHKVGWFARGYSPLSFMGLYLLARYLNLYPSRICNLKRMTYLLLYFFLVFFTTICALIVIYSGVVDLNTLYAYSSPLVITSSVFFFLFFTKLSFSNRVINDIAISSFSIYLLHCNPLFFEPVYLTWIRECASYDYFIFLGYILGIILLIFVLSIVLDKFRLFFWNILSVYCFKKVDVVR